jgi:hypothetical protein
MLVNAQVKFLVCSLSLPDSVGRTIKISEKNRETSLNVTSLCATRIPKRRDKVMENMERLLGIWIEDPSQHRVPVSLMMIQEKAKSSFVDLNSEYGEESTVTSFTVTKGWFQRFERRCNLHNIKITDEAASADSEEAIRFVPYLGNLIEEGGYS